MNLKKIILLIGLSIISLATTMEMPEPAKDKQEKLRLRILHALQTENLELLEACIKSRFDIDSYFKIKKNDEKVVYQTLLHLICEKRGNWFFKALKLVLQNHANPNICNSLAQYPLDLIFDFITLQNIFKTFSKFKKYAPKFPLMLNSHESSEILLDKIVTWGEALSIPCACFFNKYVTMPIPSYQIQFKLFDDLLSHIDNIERLKSVMLFLPQETVTKILTKLVYPVGWRFVYALHSPISGREWLTYEPDMIALARYYLDLIYNFEKELANKDSYISHLPPELRKQLFTTAIIAWEYEESEQSISERKWFDINNLISLCAQNPKSYISLLPKELRKDLIEKAHSALKIKEPAQNFLLKDLKALKDMFEIFS